MSLKIAPFQQLFQCFQSLFNKARNTVGLHRCITCCSCFFHFQLTFKQQNTPSICCCPPPTPIPSQSLETHCGPKENPKSLPTPALSGRFWSEQVSNWHFDLKSDQCDGMTFYIILSFHPVWLAGNSILRITLRLFSRLFSLLRLLA